MNTTNRYRIESLWSHINGGLETIRICQESWQTSGKTGKSKNAWQVELINEFCIFLSGYRDAAEESAEDNSTTTYTER